MIELACDDLHDINRHLAMKEENDIELGVDLLKSAVEVGLVLIFCIHGDLTFLASSHF